MWKTTFKKFEDLQFASDVYTLFYVKCYYYVNVLLFHATPLMLHKVFLEKETGKQKKRIVRRAASCKASSIALKGNADKTSIHGIIIGNFII